jgi:NAD(P)-dependent dehydrogenase (short-subunit alcohol dehydrogenase family)
VPLYGKVVLITGAARGIGAGTARVVARRGARVALVGLEPARLEALAAELGEGHVWYEADVTDSDSIEAAVAASARELGGIDVVMANAGIASYGTVQQTNPDDWIRTIDVNLNGVFRTVRAALPDVIDRSGYVLVVASQASFVPLAGMSAYAASKAGAESLASALSLEVGRLGVDVGSVHPSWIDTDMVRAVEHDLTVFDEMRSRLPRALRKTTSVAACAEAIADGIERRSARIYIPRSSAVNYWVRSLIQSRTGLRLLRREAGDLIPKMEAEIAALGRTRQKHAVAAEAGEPAPPGPEGEPAAAARTS